MGILIRPCLSISQSVAAEYKKRTNARASRFVNGSAFSFCSKIAHSFNGYPNKHPSNPRVTMKCAPNCSRNLAGIISRPLESIVCVNSPINTTNVLLYHVIGQVYHNPPLLTT